MTRNQAAAGSAAALAIWRAGLAAVQPERCVPSALRDLHAQQWSRFPEILVVGGGKAGAGMAQAVEACLPELGVPLERLSSASWLNVPNETVLPLQRIHLHPARPMGVNFPTAEAVAGTEALLERVAAASPEALLLCLISGGGSALLCAPAPGLSLEEKLAVTKLLHASGATIGEMNCVRKHLSRVKGGRLAQAFLRPEFPERRLVTLVISDVLGSPLDVIASGPTAPDPTTFADALEVLRKHGLVDRVPPAVLAELRAGVAGHREETWKAGDARGLARIVADSVAARRAAAAAAGEWGFAVRDLGDLDGDTAEAAAAMARVVRELSASASQRRWCLISGGETTVRLNAASGKGGRNQQFTLALAAELATQMQGVTILCGGTDGEDGPTDAAGGWLNAERLAAAKSLGLDPGAALARHDAYPFLDALGCLVMTGLTGTNVMDLRVVLVEG